MCLSFLYHNCIIFSNFSKYIDGLYKASYNVRNKGGFFINEKQNNYKNYNWCTST